MRIVSVPFARAEALRRELHAQGVIDRSVRMTKREGHVLIPLKGEPAVDLQAFGATIRDVSPLEPRPRKRDPLEELRQRLEAVGVPWDAAPKKWERIGEVLVLRIAEAGRPYEGKIARAFADVLRAETVVEDVSGIRGVFRTPEVRVLLGSRTETVHVEGGVRYKLDVARVMFSSGNLAERVSLAKLVRPGDVVVDLFAGIGYFTLPIAVRSRARTIHACELNPVSFQYLLENLRLNRVTNVEPHLGDCRMVAPRGVADVVLMGHFSARDYLDVAFECLRGTGTVIYHELCPKEQFPGEPVRRFSAAARSRWYDVESARTRIVKSYAPGIVHAVVESRVRRRPKELSTKVHVG
ncbi:MAG: class I SAM-dependent methyltransferase family protein [Thermoplasmata archaeon]